MIEPPTTSGLVERTTPSVRCGSGQLKTSSDGRLGMCTRPSTVVKSPADSQIETAASSANTDAASAKQLKKDSELWGELPAGSRAELIGDIAGIFDEAITNIDDVSSHDEKNPLIAKALRKLAAAATRIVEQLKPAETQAKGEAELNSFDKLAEYADSILQAANKLPPPPDKKSKTKSEKPKATN